MWVADPNDPPINEFSKSVPRHLGGGGRRRLVLCRYGSDRNESLELVIKLREAMPTVLSNRVPSPAAIARV